MRNIGHKEPGTTYVLRNLLSKIYFDLLYVTGLPAEEYLDFQSVNENVIF